MSKKKSGLARWSAGLCVSQESGNFAGVLVGIIGYAQERVIVDAGVHWHWLPCLVGDWHLVGETKWFAKTD